MYGKRSDGKRIDPGGGFGGVVAAERLAEQLSVEHQSTLILPSEFCFLSGVGDALLSANVRETMFHLICAYDGKLHEFKKGAAILAAEMKVPIIPVAMEHI